MEIAQLNDLLSVPGFTPEIVTKLKNFAIILPSTTTVNVNTASAEVLAARIGTLALDGARALVVSRDRAVFKDMADFTNRLSGQTLPPDANVGVNTGYFIVDGRVKLNRAGLEVLALIHRQAPPGIGAPPVSRVVWIQEN